jgi:hypothetical protein
VITDFLFDAKYEKGEAYNVFYVLCAISLIMSGFLNIYILQVRIFYCSFISYMLSGKAETPRGLQDLRDDVAF